MARRAGGVPKCFFAGRAAFFQNAPKHLFGGVRSAFAQFGQRVLKWIGVVRFCCFIDQFSNGVHHRSFGPIILLT